jgi:hypothetical protein
VNVKTVLELRDLLATAIGSDLGHYRREGFSPTPALWVMDRPLPKGVEVITAPLDQESVPALEVIIHHPPEIRRSPPKNFGCTGVTTYGWRVWIICHDSRQDPTAAIHRINDAFDRIEEPRFSERTDLNPDFYTLKIWTATATATDL